MKSGGYLNVHHCSPPRRRKIYYKSIKSIKEKSIIGSFKTLSWKLFSLYLFFLVLTPILVSTCSSAFLFLFFFSGKDGCIVTELDLSWSMMCECLGSCKHGNCKAIELKCSNCLNTMKKYKL